jgi:hypothetical protein
MRPLALWHLASFDAPAVAVVWSLGFAWAAEVRLAAWVLPLLWLMVWAVYVFDRLLDARSALRAAEAGRLRERHYFHWRHRRVLLPLAVIASCAAAGLILTFMPAAGRERGSVLAAVSLVYFARVHSGRRRRPFLSALLTKELLVGLLFTAGCALPAFGALRAAHHSLWPLACAVGFFAPLAWLNCHAIDDWESRARHERSPEIAGAQNLPQGLKPILSSKAFSARLKLGPDTEPQRRSSFWVPCVLAAVGFLLALPISISHPRTGALLAAGAVSALLLALLDRKRDSLTPVALRAAADLVLLAPAPLLALAWLAR